MIRRELQGTASVGIEVWLTIADGRGWHDLGRHPFITLETRGFSETICETVWWMGVGGTDWH